MTNIPASPYQVMPGLTNEEYAELKEDIKKRGVMVPIEYDESGNVLDGLHRLLICSELGIRKFPKVIRIGMSEQEKRAHARKLNMARRHLTQDQKRSMIREQLLETPELSDRQIAAGIGVDHKTVAVQRKRLESIGEIPQCSRRTSDGREYPSQRRTIAVFNPTAREEKAVRNPAVVEKLAAGEAVSVMAANKAVTREVKNIRKSFDLPSGIPDTCRLFTADIRSGLPDIADSSVDFIITDPPYPKEYLPLYGDLSKLAARVLKPGGSLLAMCGQSWLPEVIAELGKEMDYHWMLSYLTPGGQSPRLWQKRVNTFWKPVLWYVKDGYKCDTIGDVIKSPVNNNDKRFHHWGQSVAGFEETIEKFTYPGQTILDPFLGGGTTGVAAVAMGRTFIGCDIEERNVGTARERIEEAIQYARSEAGADRLEG